MAGDERSANDRVEIAIAVVERDGAFLIGQRPAGAALAECWEFPGGKLLPGESPTDAARRECLEETGLEVQIVGALPIAEHDYPHASVRLRFFACEALCQHQPLPDRFRWVSRTELADYRFPAANDDVLADLLRIEPTR
ncbi:MAG: (deoxy)nucleoside triphosphate pyrophosphohydrolase [Pirellulales bacterium]